MGQRFGFGWALLLAAVLVWTGACTASRPPTPTPTAPATATPEPTPTTPATKDRPAVEITATQTAPDQAAGDTATSAPDQAAEDENTATPTEQQPQDQATGEAGEQTEQLSEDLLELQQLLSLEEPVEGAAKIDFYKNWNSIEAQEDVALHTVFDLLSMYEQVTGQPGIVQKVREALDLGQIEIIWWNEVSYAHFPDMMGSLRVYDAAVWIYKSNGKIQVEPLNEGGAGILAEEGYWAVQSNYGQRKAVRTNISYLVGIPERMQLGAEIEMPSHNQILIMDSEHQKILGGLDFITVQSGANEPTIYYNVVITPIKEDSVNKLLSFQDQSQQKVDSKEASAVVEK